jgi:hypothetical protein
MTDSEDDYLTEEETISTYYSDTNSAKGAASLSRSEVETFLGHAASRKLVNMLNAASRDTKTEALLLKVRGIVERLPVDAKAKETIQLKAEQLALALRKNEELNTNEVAVATIIKILREYGWSFERITRTLAAIDKRLAAVKDLYVVVKLERTVMLYDNSSRNRGAGSGQIIEQYDNSSRNNGVSDGVSNRVRVSINGEPRYVKILNNGNLTTRLLRIPVYMMDDGGLLEIHGARICITHERNEAGSVKLVCRTDSKRLQIIDAHRAVLMLRDSFEPLKLLKRVELGDIALKTAAQRRIDACLFLRRYWTDKLPITEHLLAYAGVLAQFRARYSELFTAKFEKEEVWRRLTAARENDVLLRSPKSLAEEAIFQADDEVWSSLPTVRKAAIRRVAEERGLSKEDLKYTGIKGFIVKSELKRWEE